MISDPLKFFFNELRDGAGFIIELIGLSLLIGDVVFQLALKDSLSLF